MKFLPALLLSALVTVLWWGGASAQGRCNQLNIRITNLSGYEVKISKVEYFDPTLRQWRVEAQINQLLKEGATWSWPRSLESVLDATTQLRVTYQKKRAAGLTVESFGAELQAESSQFTCKDNATSPTISLR